MGSLMKAAMLMLLLSMALLSRGITAEGVCNMSTENFEACKPAVSGTAPEDPSEECCSALGHADLQCLCSYRNSPLLQALGIDPDLAMQLPLKCKLTPPSQC